MRLATLILVIWVGVITGISDIDLLLQFIDGIKEDDRSRGFGSWNRRNLSDSNGCPVDWYGIQCSGTRISSITLNDMGLIGNIDFSALAGMEKLQNLSLSNNRLMVTSSPELVSISSLEFLDLSRNSFSGSIPLELAKMENLVYLNLSTNNFEGKVSVFFASLTRLKYLDLRGNNFSGDLDGILAELQNAVHVDLSQNQFSGSLNSISDDSPIVNSLKYLNISRNGLSGELFSDGLLPLFDSLEVFDASFNWLGGNIPSFNFIVSLKILHLRRNQFNGSLPEELLMESSMVLNELDLSCNQLAGPITSITSASLKYLNLSTNGLLGSLPSRVGTCSVVDLSNNKLSGNLSTVHNWGNYVEFIDVSSNILTGTLPNETSQFLRLISFRASNNSLSGELPLVIGTYPELNDIDLSRNMLYGSLPPSLFELSRLRDLNLSGNSFTGSIPFPDSQRETSTSSDDSSTTQRSNLVSLDLSHNLLSGTLPPEIGFMTGLKLLNIERNNISGQIPKEIGMLHLLNLDLSNNYFEGKIPDDLPNTLVVLNVSYNNLSGTVPGDLMRFPDSSFHPGNSLLIFPLLPPLNGTTFGGRGKHSQHLKPAIIYGLIAGAVACATLILLSILFYRRASYRNNPLGLRKSVDPPPASLSFSHDQLLQPRSVSMTEDVSFTARESAENEIEEFSTKIDRLDHAEASIPTSEAKSSMSPSNDPCLDMNSSITNVHSPDRLEGDLHLFENSFIFTAGELSRAPAEIIGRSCHGTSCKATLDVGHMLVVKWMREGTTKGKKEFAREAKKLGNIRHPNIVLLRGYYWGPKEHERLIISDYICAESLTAHLCEFEQRNLPPLSLPQRIAIAVDVARGLDYLHYERSIPHGNLKSANVLVRSPDLAAVLADYSLHRIMTPAGTADQVLNAGALGYLAPEFASTSKPCPSLKGDVYAFGVLLVELLTGRGAGEIVSSNPGVVDLTDWVRLLVGENRSYECFDRCITAIDGSPEAMEAVLKVAVRCIGSAAERPEIRTVFQDLSSISL